MRHDSHTHHPHSFKKLFSIGRHRGGRGFGHFAAGFRGGAGFGDEGFRSGRKLGSADLQLLILSLLNERPSHGYELIKSLEERSKGFYSPSPGMIYPALTYLEEVGHATVESQGSKKLYRLTDGGREHLENNRIVVDAILAQIEQIGSRMDQVRRVFREGDGADGDDEGDGPGPRLLWQARRGLKAALHQKRGCSIEEARRVAAILEMASAEILKK